MGFADAEKMGAAIGGGGNGGGGNGGGGNGGGGPNRSRRIYLPVGAKDVVLFLDDPRVIREHQYGGGRDRQYATCMGKGRCPECQSDDKSRAWAPTVGFHTVIRLSSYTTKDGRIFLGGRDILAAKWGGKDKPATLQRLKLIADDFGGHIAGCVIECHRMGKMSDSVGDNLKLLNNIAPDVIRNANVDVGAGNSLFDEHLRPAILEYLEPRFTKYLEAVNKGRAPDKVRTLETHYRYNPIAPIDFETYLDPRNNPRSNWMEHEEFDPEEKAEERKSAADSFEEEFGGATDDEDIPF